MRKELLQIYSRCMVATTQTRSHPILVYDDIAAAHDFLVATLGFEPGRVDRGNDGAAVHGEIAIGP